MKDRILRMTFFITSLLTSVLQQFSSFARHTFWRAVSVRCRFLGAANDVESAAMKPRPFELAVLLLFLMISGYQLFVRPLIGISDNGDFYRLFQPAGLQEMPTERLDKYFYYFNSQYRIVAKPSIPRYYRSSSVVPVYVARWLNTLLIDGQVFDIRVLGAIHLTAFLFGIYLILISSRQIGIKWRVLLAGLLLFFFTDPAYTAYFNSFYSEATALVCLVLIVGCAGVLIAGESSSWIVLGVFFAAAAMLVTAKPMYVPLAILLAPFGFYLSRLISLKRRFWFGGVLACALVPLAALYSMQTPKWLRQHVNYIAIFTELLKESPTPEQDLRDLGLNPEWARYADTTPFQQESPLLRDPAFTAEFTSGVSSTTVPRFFLTHPSRFFTRASLSAKGIFATRVSYAGYYEKSTGRPPQTKPPSPWSVVRSWLFPASIWLFIVYLASVGPALWFALRRRLNECDRGMLLLYCVLVGFGAMVFLVPVATMATMNPRFSSTFASSFDMNLILVIAGLSRAPWKRGSASVSTSQDVLELPS